MSVMTALCMAKRQRQTDLRDKQAEKATVAAKDMPSDGFSYLVCAASDEDLVRAGNLRKSARIRAKVQRLWQLMVVETLQASASEGTAKKHQSIGVRHGQHPIKNRRK